jgi:hypothetical protein
MKRGLATLLIGLSGLVLGGCTTYQVIRMPNTSEGLAAFRQCTTVSHTGLLTSCMSAIPDVHIGGYRYSPPQTPDGCYTLTTIAQYDPAWGDTNYIVVQVCQDAVLNPAPPSVPGSAFPTPVPLQPTPIPTVQPTSKPLPPLPPLPGVLVP